MAEVRFRCNLVHNSRFETRCMTKLYLLFRDMFIAITVSLKLSVFNNIIVIINYLRNGLVHLFVRLSSLSVIVLSVFLLCCVVCRFTLASKPIKMCTKSDSLNN